MLEVFNMYMGVNNTDNFGRLGQMKYFPYTLFFIT